MYRIILQPTDNGIIKSVKDNEDNRLDYKVFEIKAHGEANKDRSNKIKKIFEDILKDLALLDDNHELTVKTKNKSYEN